MIHFKIPHRLFIVIRIKAQIHNYYSQALTQSVPRKHFHFSPWKSFLHSGLLTPLPSEPLFLHTPSWLPTSVSLSQRNLPFPLRQGWVVHSSLPQPFFLNLCTPDPNRDCLLIHVFNYRLETFICYKPSISWGHKHYVSCSSLNLSC